jgi:hypothetical protein
MRLFQCDVESVMLYTDFEYQRPDEWFKMKWNPKPSATNLTILRVRDAVV